MDSNKNGVELGTSERTKTHKQHTKREGQRFTRFDKMTTSLE